MRTIPAVSGWRVFQRLHGFDALEQRGKQDVAPTPEFIDQNGERPMRSQLTILALWVAIYITSLILAMFLIAVLLYILQ